MNDTIEQLRQHFREWHWGTFISTITLFKIFLILDLSFPDHSIHPAFCVTVSCLGYLSGCKASSFKIQWQLYVPILWNSGAKASTQ